MAVVPGPCHSLEDPTVNPQTETPKTSANGRQSNGRFAKGNKFGPGNPFSRKVAGLRSALLRKIDEEHIERVADKLLAMALEGDLAAIKLVLLYAVGRPAEPVNPDDLDRLEFEQHRANGAPLDDVREILNCLFPLGLANECLRHALPCVQANLARAGAEVFRAAEEPAPPQPEDDGEAADDEPADAPPAAADAPPSPAPAPEPAVLPLSRGAVNKREQRPARAANRGRSATARPERPRGRPSTNGGDGSERKPPAGGGRASESGGERGA